MNPETLKAMKDQVEHAKAVGQRKFLIDPESVSALIAEVERQAWGCGHCTCTCDRCAPCGADVENWQNTD